MVMRYRKANTRGRRAPRRGVLLLDLVGGIVLVGVLFTLIAVTMSETRLAAKKLADRRAAARAADAALIERQSRGVEKVTMESVSDEMSADAEGEATSSSIVRGDVNAARPTPVVTWREAPGGEAPDGMRWVCAVASCGEATVEVCGLAPGESP